MPAKHPLTDDEVTALFAGHAPAPKAPRRAAEPAGPWVRRYDRCANCQITQPCLLSFSGDTDFDMSIPRNDRIRLEIAILRQTTGRRTINLCAPCVEALRSPRESNDDHGLEAQLAPSE